MNKPYSTAMDSATSREGALPLLTPVAMFMAVAVIAAIAAFIIKIEMLQLSGNLGENSLVEYTQELYLCLTSTLFFGVAMKQPAQKGFAVLVSAFFMVLLIRELDGLLDLIWHGFWKFPAAIVAVTGMFYAYKHPQTTQPALSRYSQHASFGLMLGGLATLLVFSRLFGMGEIWQAAMQDNYVREIKNLAEEGVELLGYSLILAAAIWYCLPYLVNKKQRY
ncbi:hypothetical protein CAG70_02855 [Photobacterium halotolerans]|uniref:Uncharacterized protein n=1 Tax=Photobacterium halotolerans TaxID=265726 RepID=A0A7X4XVA6_9GAMM|nr:hypothetical protein [Photobacterium halotolerans]NAW65846.1 hypothetical protein [Photobacterium halotolerans]NAX45943.1 hypothetical protein [Photobacterium halotolerans]